MIEHKFKYYEKGFPARPHPLYLILFGVGTGKSRNATELHKTAYKGFNEGYFKGKNERLASQLQYPIVLHASFENDTGIRPCEGNP